VSRRTPEWDRLLKEGLHHPSANYPNVRDLLSAEEKAQLAADEARITAEWPGGACLLREQGPAAHSLRP